MSLPRAHALCLLSSLSGLALFACAGEPDPSGDAASDATGDASSSESSSESGSESEASTSESASEESGDGDEGDGDGDSEPFEIVVLDRAWISSYMDSQDEDASFDLGEGPFASVILEMELDTWCFPFDTWDSADNPIPDGHNWPAKCDAYDRNVDVVIDPALEVGQAPGFRAVHAITPFGGPMTKSFDITDWANMHPGAHDLRGHISTWTDGAGQVSGSEGGWFMSVRIHGERGPMPRPVVAAISLFNGGFDHATGAQTWAFELPPETTSARLVYTTSGHGGVSDPGGCSGPADEFCARNHVLSLDGELLQEITPWRGDCFELCTETEHTWPGGSTFTYCAENPCGAISSVNASRANWCPGDIVRPFEGNLPITSGGPHSFGLEIQDIAEGGSWTNSVTIYAYGP